MDEFLECPVKCQFVDNHLDARIEEYFNMNDGLIEIEIKILDHNLAAGEEITYTYHCSAPNSMSFLIETFSLRFISAVNTLPKLEFPDTRLEWPTSE